MPSRKRTIGATISASSNLAEAGRKRRRSLKSESPSSRGLDLEPTLQTGPQRQSSPKRSTPPPTLKHEPTTPAKVRTVAKEVKESPSKMSPAKLKVLESLGSSPFPDFAQPTPGQCRAVNSALVKRHGSRIRPAHLNKPGLGANCGEVPSVLDALIRTILSQNTNNKNSSSAKKSLDRRFGKGNYEAIHWRM
jgi:endonuclease-3